MKKIDLIKSAKDNSFSKNNVIAFKKEEKTLLSIADEKFANDDLIGALSLYLEIERAEKFNVNLYKKIANLYMELGLYSQAIEYWFKYLDNTTSKHFVEAYNGLGGSFYLAEIYPYSVYYYNLQINDKYDAELPYDDFMYELFPQQDEKKSPFKLVDTNYEIDCDKFEKAREVFDVDKKQAFEILQSIDKTSKKYTDAQGLTAVFYLFCEQFEESIKAYENVLEIKSDADFALNNLFALHFLLAHYEKADKYYQAIIKNECADYGFLEKYFHLFYAKNMHNENYEYAKKISLLFPNSPNTLIASGCAAYNVGKFVEAHDYFLKYHKISPNYATKRYCKLTKDAIDGKQIEQKTIDFNLSLPKFEIERLEQLVKEYAEMPLYRLKQKSQELYTLLEATFCTHRPDLQTMACNFVADLKTKCAKKTLINLLLRNNVSDNIKSLIIAMLVKTDYDKPVGVVFGNIYIKLPFEPIEFGEYNGDIFKLAYAIAFGKIAPIFEDAIDRLKREAYDVYYKLLLNGNVFQIDNPIALSALFAIKAEVKFNNDNTALLDYFGTTEDDVAYLFSLLKDEPVALYDLCNKDNSDNGTNEF